jgi:ATP-dependent helicase Lhr and Lhr-like helicase
MQKVFNLLNKKVADLAKKRFKRATNIQNLTIPKVLKGKDLLVISGTGTGKSESVFLPILSKLASEPHKPIALLYLTPLKALNRDMLDRLVWWSHKLGLEIGVRHGDTTPAQRKVQVEYPPHILISTPEQIQAMLSGKNLRKILANIKYIIVDEVHELADSKRGIQLTLGLERLKRLCGKPQIIALSATVGSPKRVADFLGCEEIIKAASEKQFSLDVKSPVPTKDDSKLAEKIFVGDSVAARLRVIHDSIKKHESTLIFTNTRQSAEILSSRLKKMDSKLKQSIHHSSLSKSSRIATEEDFKSGKTKAIICTSSLQLGIDIGKIDLVLQYQSPREVSQLTQRFGRAGHSIDKTSKGIIIASEGDDLFESAVIARRVHSGQIEALRFFSAPLDVLAHQIVGLAHGEYKIQLDDVYKTIKKAGPYRDVTKKQFSELLEFMNSLKLIWINDNTTPEERKGKNIVRGRKAIKYYFENLSTIPDSRSYMVIDHTINRSIGSLDENFVMEHSDTGSTFIVKGTPWRVLSVEGNRVFVEPSSNIESAVPTWDGDQIPVPFDTAQEVADLREKIYRELKKDENKKTKQSNQRISDILNTYPIDATTKKKMIKVIKRQLPFEIAGKNKITFEQYGEFVIINSCFGSLVNETLSRYISAMITAEYGRAVQAKTDPYRIIFQKVQLSDIKRILMETKPSDLQIVLENSLRNSSLFKYRFLWVAKRFGAIRKDARFERLGLKRLINVYQNTPLYEEVLNEIFTEKLDIEGTESVLRDIQNKKIKLVDTKLSPIGEFGLRYELHDVATPNRPEKEILRFYKRRLMNTKLRLVCVHCGKWDQTYFVRDIPKIPRCTKCSSRLISSVHPHMTEAKTIVKKRLDGKSLTQEEQSKLIRIRRAADMIIVYGKTGCIALAGRGIGPQTCARVLAKMHRNEDALYKDMLAAEKNFIQTKQYWSD